MVKKYYSKSLSNLHSFPELVVKNIVDKQTSVFCILYVIYGGISHTIEVTIRVFNALSIEFQIKEIGSMKHSVGYHTIHSIK